MSDVILEVIDLVKDYRSVRAVDHLSFAVGRGRVVGLIGPNGAGKTTTFNIICRFIKASSGRVLISGCELDRFHMIKGRISALPQDAALPEGVGLARQLAYYARLQGLPADRARSEARRVLEQVGLGDHLRRFAGTLSHGMHKRAAMAQAFLGSPDIILLDEPTSGLDPRNAAEARDLITRLKGETSVVVSSHNLAEIQSVCDDVVIIDHGRLVYQGSMEELTGQAVRFKVLLRSDREVSLDPIRLIEGVGDASLEQEPRAVQVDCAQDADEARVTTEVLRRLLDEGHLVVDIERGSSLEERFLGLTGEGEGEGKPGGIQPLGKVE